MRRRGGVCGRPARVLGLALLLATSACRPAGAPVPHAAPGADTGAPAAVPAPSGTALAALAALPVKGRAAKPGYDRALFGTAWADRDGDGCDSRQDVLRRDLVDVEPATGCPVRSGTASPEPYTGRDVAFRAGSSGLDVDHVVALGNAWQTGAQSWSAAQRQALADDPLELLLVDASANRQKGDGDAATWLPPSRAYRCAYVARQVAVKRAYGLWVTPAEHDAVARVLATCPGEPLPAAARAPAPPPASPHPVQARRTPAARRPGRPVPRRCTAGSPATAPGWTGTATAWPASEPGAPLPPSGRTGAAADVPGAVRRCQAV